MSIYETERLRDEYLLFHYGSPDQVCPWKQAPREGPGFPARIVERFSPGEVVRALDLGCAVGRSAFEMSRAAAQVIAIDYSEAFVDSAREVQTSGRVPVSCLTEGHRTLEVFLELPPGVHPGRVVFERGDAMNLRADLGSFERVLAANLLCRLSKPGLLLERLPELVAPDGELVLTTPCTWLEEFTPASEWPPGTTREWLVDSLAPCFELLEEHDEPFLIRETARKFQWTVALLTKWRRK